jgi:citrate lyase beta subunit
MSGAVVRALGVGRPVLVSAGSAAAEEFPDGIVVPVTPGPAEEDELEALLRHLQARPELRDRIGTLAAAHLRHAHGLEATVETLAGFLRGVEAGQAAAVAALEAARAEEGSLLGYFIEEIRWGARDLGLAELRLGLEGLLEPLAGRPHP